MDETLSFIEFIEQGGKDSQDEYERERGGVFRHPPAPPTVRPRNRRRSAGCGKTMLVGLVHLVCLVFLVYLVEPDKQDKPDKRDGPERPDKPNNKFGVISEVGDRRNGWLRQFRG